MAEKFGVSVLGVDLSVNMFMIALERSLNHSVDVSFEVADITRREYPKHSFDVVYSRDTILHIDDKPALFNRSANLKAIYELAICIICLLFCVY